MPTSVPGGASTGGTSPHHHQARALFDHHLALHPHLSAAQQQEYRQAAFAIFDQMTPLAVERFNRHVSGYRFFPDLVSLNQHFTPGVPPKQVAQVVALGLARLGAYNETTGEVEINGPSRLGLQQFSVAYICTHEFAHAVDGPRKEISLTQEWRDAWAAEIRPAFPNQNAAADAHEGSAKWGQLLWESGSTQATLGARFPNCADVWKKWGIW